MDIDQDRPGVDIDALAADVELEEDDVDLDEELDTGAMAQDAWLVKVPRFLAERWAEHAAKGGKGTELGRMRVYDADANGKRKIELVVPPAPSLASVPANYKVDIRNPNASRMYILDELAEPQVIGSEKLEDDGPSTSNGAPKGKKRAKLARRPRLSATVRHECVVQPVDDESYRAVMRARQKQASQPKRTIKQLEGDLGTMNRMASGVATGQSQAKKFANLAAAARGPKRVDRLIRMARSDLLDQLFEGFKRYEYWSMKSLRDATKQPEAYLREVLSDVAILLKVGPYAGHWRLKEEYRKINLQASTSASGSGAAGKQEDDEDEEMEEMEAVA